VTALLPPLAHAGPGSTWQAMVVVVGVVLAGVVLAAAFGRVRIEGPDDLLVPLAGAAIASSLGVIGHAVVSDAIGWGLPLAVVSLVALLLAAFTPLDLRLPGPLPMGAIAAAAVGGVVLYAPLTIALHPPPDVLPLAEDSEVTIVAPSDGGEVEAGNVEVVVAVSGGTIGPGGVPLEELPADPEEAGEVVVAVAQVQDDGSTAQQQRVAVDPGDDCTVAAPCDEVAFEVPLEPGSWELTVEFTRGDGTPLAPYVRDRITLEAS
jgi:hypothetical protein